MTNLELIRELMGIEDSYVNGGYACGDFREYHQVLDSRYEEFNYYRLRDLTLDEFKSLHRSEAERSFAVRYVIYCLFEDCIGGNIYSVSDFEYKEFLETLCKVSVYSDEVTALRLIVLCMEYNTEIGSERLTPLYRLYVGRHTDDAAKKMIRAAVPLDNVTGEDCKLLRSTLNLLCTDTRYSEESVKKVLTCLIDFEPSGEFIDCHTKQSLLMLHNSETVLERVARYIQK